MNLKKFTQKNADGSSVTYEFDVPKMQGIPDHPGEPKGTDTVPAWLTPGEFVVNAEATRMFEPQIEAMNEVGKVVQKAQGGSIPEYHEDGGIAGISDDNRSMNFRMADLVDKFGVDAVRDKINYLKKVDPNYNTSRLEESLAIFDRVPNTTTNPDYIQDNFDVTKSALANRYNDSNRQNPAVPAVNSMGQNPMASVPNPDDLSPMATPATFSSNLGLGDEPTLIPNFPDAFENPSDLVAANTNSDSDEPGYFQKLLSGDMPLATSNVAAVSGLPPKDRIEVLTDNPFTNMFKDISDFMKAGNTADINQRQRSADLTGDASSLDTVSQIQDIISDKNLTEETKDQTVEDTTQVGIDYINQMQNMSSNKQPSNGDVGDIYTNSFADKADGFLTSVKNFFTENFSDLIDGDKLMNAALLYVGSRALGSSHGGALNFVGRTYLGEIQKKLQVADKAALSNKYTKESVKKYRDTGKVEDLQLKPTTFQDQEVRSYVNRMGEQFNVITQKSSDGKVRHVDSRTGKVIPSLGKLTLQTDFDSNQAKARTMIENNLKSQFNAMIPKDERDEFASRIATPESVASLMAVKFAAMGISPSKGGEIMNRVYRNMINDVKNGVEDSLIDEAAALPYINKQIMEASMKEFGIAEMFEGASSEAVETALGFNLKGSDPLQVKQEADDLATLWKTLTPEGAKYYRGRAVEGKPAIIILAEEVNSGQANKDFFKKPKKD